MKRQKKSKGRNSPPKRCTKAWAASQEKAVDGVDSFGSKCEVVVTIFKVYFQILYYMACLLNQFKEIHWDYEKKAEPELMAGKNGVNKFISDSYGYGGYRESEMARDQWKDLTYDAQHGSGASKNRKSYYDNWDQDFEQTYVR